MVRGNKVTTGYSQFVFMKEMVEGRLCEKEY